MIPSVSPYKDVPAEAWKTQQDANLLSLGIPTWANHPQGDYSIDPRLWIRVDRTFEYDPRISILGLQMTTINTTSGFIASDEFGVDPGVDMLPGMELPFVLSAAAGYQQRDDPAPRWNHPNGATFMNFTVNGRGRGSLYSVGGAQCTRLDNLAFFNPHRNGTALQVRESSHALSMSNLNFQGGSASGYGTRAGEALRFSGASGNGSNMKIYLFEKGIVGDGSHDVFLSGLHFEKVHRPITIGHGSSNWDLQGEIQTAGPIIADFTKFRGAIRLQFRIRKQANNAWAWQEAGLKKAEAPGWQPIYVLDYFGNEQQIGGVHSLQSVGDVYHIWSDKYKRVRSETLSRGGPPTNPMDEEEG